MSRGRGALARALVVLLLLVTFSQAATFTVKASGNWSAEGATTWNEAGHPVAGDTVTIDHASNYTITVDVASAAAAVTVGKGVLVLNAQLTLTGDLNVGNGASKDGVLTFGPSGDLYLNGGHWYWNNCTINSTAVSASWAKVTGTGNVAKGAAYSLPKVSWDLSYVSFQNTGTVAIISYNSSGTPTPLIDLDHVAFVGTGAITFGSTSIPVTSHFRLDHLDFRDPTGNLIITRAAGTITGDYYLKNSTGSSATVRSILFQGADGLLVDNVVLDGLTLTGSTSGGHTFQGSFVSCPDDFADGTVVASSGTTKPVSHLVDSYLYQNSTNPHGASLKGNGGTGSVTGNVFETPKNTANMLLIGGTGGTVDYAISQNLLIGRGVLINNVGASTGGTISGNRNTVYLTAAGTSEGLWLSENGAHAGTINLQSNLIAAAASSTEVYAANVAQTIALSDYNDFHNVGVPKYAASITLTSGETNDLALDPQFVDATRSLATWDTARGSGTGTVAAAKTYLLAANGYNGTTKTQSDSPSANGPADLVSWVRAGFQPQNQALNGAGYGGVDIGAVDLANPAAGGGVRRFGPSPLSPLWRH